MAEGGDPLDLARRVVLVFPGNAFEVRINKALQKGQEAQSCFACLPILGSLLNHSCDANCLRLVEQQKQQQST